MRAASDGHKDAPPAAGASLLTYDYPELHIYIILIMLYIILYNEYDYNICYILLYNSIYVLMTDITCIIFVTIFTIIIDLASYEVGKSPYRHLITWRTPEAFESG